jgi:hypothetical protein
MFMDSFLFPVAITHKDESWGFSIHRRRLQTADGHVVGLKLVKQTHARYVLRKIDYMYICLCAAIRQHSEASLWRVTIGLSPGQHVILSVDSG